MRAPALAWSEPTYNSPAKPDHGGRPLDDLYSVLSLMMDASGVIGNLRVIGWSFVPVVAGGLVYVGFGLSGRDPVDDDVGRIGLIVAAVVGVGGLAAAVVWRNRVTDRPVAPRRLSTTFFLTLAVAEAGMLVGFTFTFVSHVVAPFLAGAGLFSVALVTMLSALSMVEVAAADTTGLER